MKLESEGRPAIQDAQARDVYAAVSGLALPGHSFLIVSRTQTSYVQVAMQAGERFVIEYREGGPRSLRSVREDYSRNEVAQLLESYLAGGDAWRAGIQWRSVEDMSPRDGWDTVSTA
jgi:aromatic ring hydroxylase